MKRALIFGSLLVLAVVIGAGVSSARAKWAEQRRETAYQAAVQSYRSVLTTGMSRKQVEESLHDLGVGFIEFPAYSEDSAYSDLIKIGEESDHWYCGPGSVNVAVRFETGTNRRVLEDPSDTVKGLALFKLFEDCM